MHRAFIFVRSALFMAVIVITVIPYAFATLLWAPFLNVHWRYKLTCGWPWIIIRAARWICGIRWKTEGWDNLPDGPAIVLSKHQSAWETLWLAISMPRDLTFVYKRELHLVPFFGWGLALMKMINIDRKKGQEAFEQVVEQGKEKLAEGRWIVLFPEGTRTAPGAKPRYKTGGARLAVRTGATIVPIALNSGECWPRQAFIKTPGLITVSICAPIDPSGKTVDEVARLVETSIESEMRRIAPHRYGS